MRCGISRPHRAFTAERYCPIPYRIRVRRYIPGLPGKPEKPGKIREIGHGTLGKARENIKETGVLNFAYSSLKLLLFQIIFIIF